MAPLKSVKLPLLFTVGISLQYYHKLPDVFEQLSIFLLSLYIGITILIYSALPIWVLFILLMQLVNEEQFLNINFLSVLFATAPPVEVLSPVILPLTSICASL